MTLTRLRQLALLSLIGSAIYGCGGGATDPATPASANVSANAPAAETAQTGEIAGPPTGWYPANTASAAHYQAGRFAEAIAVLEAFAKAHPSFADVELMIGDNWWTMPGTAPLPPPERLARAARHLRRGLQLATDDYGRDWGTSSLLHVYREQVRDSASLTPDARRQLIVDARPFVAEVLRKDPTNADGLRIKSRLLEIEAQ